MSNAVKIADITITVRLEAVRLYVTATKKRKRPQKNGNSSNGQNKITLT